jgi:hypothetical protein
LQFRAGLLLQGFRLRDLIRADDSLFHEHIGKVATGFAHLKMPPLKKPDAISFSPRIARMGTDRKPRVGVRNAFPAKATPCRRRGKSQTLYTDGDSSIRVVRVIRGEIPG